MAVRWLTDMASVLRSGGVTVKEVAGWQTRCFVSPDGKVTWPGYETGPTHVMCHHSADPIGTPPATAVEYIMNGASWGKNIANIYLDRSGVWWVIAAGRTATNGEGHDSWGGGVPDNKMNDYAIGIEAGNNGVGEPWPTVQTTSYAKGVAALCKAYKIPVAHVRAHAEWSPGRKIDPAGPSPWSVSGTWNMNAFRNSVTVAMGQQPAPSQNPSPAPSPLPPTFDPAKGKFGLYPLDPFKATIRLNSAGDLVRYLQGVLKKKGYNVVLDGFFGPQTDGAVKKYQLAHNLIADGIVGAAQTWPKIDFDATH